MAEGMEFEPVNLWAKVKATCLGTNPFIKRDDEGKRIVQCPRCETWFREEEMIILTIMPVARQWCSPVRKCPRTGCGHLFSYIE